MLGDISPQTVRITQQAVVYPSRDHVTSLRVERFDGRTYKPVDLTAVNRVILSFPEADPVIVYDSSVQAVFTHVGTTLTVDLSDYAMPASVLGCQIILYDAEHPAGQVLVDDIDAVVQFDFRNVSPVGGIPAPAVDYLTDAPIDGVTYARKDGVWVPVDALVSGVSSVNGQSGVVVLDAADVGADPAGTATTAAAAAVAAHTALADPHPQYLTPTEGNAAYDASGAATSAVSAHVAESDPHPQYTTQPEGDARYERGLTAGANITIDRTNPVAPVISASGGGGGGAVDSVNGQTGVVVLDATDVGADAAGTAAAAVAAHTALADPHPQYLTPTEANVAYERVLTAGTNVTIDRTNPSAPVINVSGGGGGGAVDSVNGQVGVVVLDAADVGADVAGAATAAVAAHTALSDPHPQYLTPAEAASAYAPLAHVGSGGAAHANAIAAGAAGFMTGTDKTKLDGVAAGATQNSADATLLARANHTGTQTASTISDFASASRAQTEAELVAGTNVTITPSGSGATRQLTIAAAGGGGSTNLSTTTSTTTLTVNSDTGTDAVLPAATPSVAGVLTAADKTKLDGIATGATQNSSDAFLRARGNHTGTQLSTTISDFVEASQDVIGAAITAGANVTVSYNDTTGLTTIDATGGAGGGYGAAVSDYAGGDPTGAANSHSQVAAAIATGNEQVYLQPGALYRDDTYSNAMGAEYVGGGKIVKNITGGQQQINTNADKNQRVSGKEYCYALHNVLMTQYGTPTRPLALRFSGDSTTAGDGISSASYFINNLAKELFYQRGLNPMYGITSTNAGQSGKNTEEWNTTYAAADAAAAPDLLVLRWGVNDGSRGAAAFITSLRAGLTTVRAARSWTQTTILLMSPNSTSDTPNMRDEKFYESVIPGIKQAARDFQCVFADTYSHLKDVRGAAGVTMDNPYSDGRAIHPKELFNVWITDLIAQAVLPDSLKLAAGRFELRSVGGLESVASASTAPASYLYGHHIHRATPANGFPVDGTVLTWRSQDGLVMQINYPYKTVDQATHWVRYGSSTSGAGIITGWSPWVDTGSASVAAYEAVVTVTGTAKTAVLTDAGTYQNFNNTAAKAYTIPPQSSVAWAADTTITVANDNTSNLTIVAGSGVTLKAPSGGTLVVAPDMVVTLKRTSADVWRVIGQTL